MSSSREHNPDGRRSSRRPIMRAVGLVSVLFLLAGLIIFFADPLGLPPELLDVLDKRASVGSLFAGTAGLFATAYSLLQQGQRPPVQPAPEQTPPDQGPPPAVQGTAHPAPAGAEQPADAEAALRASAVRVTGRAGVGGGGCLVGPREVVTCAHVVSAALGLRGGARPAGPVMVDFPLLGESYEPVAARVVAWDAARDVAGLRLDAPPPPGAAPTRLVTAPAHWGHSFRVLGFPPGRTGSGVWASGRLLARLADGRLQVEQGDGTRRLRRGFSGAVVWDDVLDAAVGVVAAQGQPKGEAGVIPADVLMTAWPWLGGLAHGSSPYRGLEAFGEDDAEVFFGRKEESRQLLTRVSGPGLTVVLGPSGSGKSSLVMAGLLPRLRARSGVLVLTLRPSQGRTPLSALAAALLPVLEPDTGETARVAAIPALAGVLREGGIVEVVRRLRERSGAKLVVLVVDQFEEVYTSRHPHEEFVAALLPALETPSAGTHVLVTLRADFAGRLLEHQGLAEVQRDALYPVGPLGRDRLREAIEGPVERVGGVTFDPGLVDRILDAVGDEPGALPLVEFALTELWDQSRGGRLRHETYRRLGGVEGAVAAYAERVWGELRDEDRPRARSLFLQLVRQAHGQEPTCAVLPRELLGEEEWRLGQDLAATRLLVAAEGPQGVQTLRLAHESLITRWDRLRGWVEADHPFRVWHSELQQALERWTARPDKDLLPRGTDLDAALAWLERRGEDVRPAERAFIVTALSEADRARRVARWRQVTLAALLVASMVLGLLVYRGYLSGQEQLRASAARVLAGRSELHYAPRADLGILEALAAYASDPDRPEARQALFNRYADHVTKDRGLSGAAVTASTLLASEDGDLVLQAVGREVRIWRPESGRPLPDRISVSSWVIGAALTPDGRLLAIVTDDGTVELWNPRDRRLVDKVTSPRPAPGTRALVALAPDGGQVAVRAGDTPGVTVWDLRRRRSHEVPLPGAAVTLRIARDGLLSAALTGGRLLVFEPRATRPARTLRVPAAFGHADTAVAICGDSGTGSRVRVVDLRTGRDGADALFPPLRCAEVSGSGALTHGGRLLLLPHVLVDLRERRILGAPGDGAQDPLVTGEEGRWSIWATGQPGVVRFPVARSISANPYRVLDSAVTGDGKYVITADDDGRVRAWDATSGLLAGERLPTVGTGPPTEEKAETRVAPVAGRGEVAVLRADSRDLVLLSVPDLRPTGSAALPADPDPAMPLALHAVAGGRLVAFAGGLVSAWDTAPLRQAGPGLDLRRRLPALTAPQPGVSGPGLLPSGDGGAVLVTDPATRTVERWDLALGRVTRSHVLPGADQLTAVAASPDLTRLVTYETTEDRPFTSWRLPAPGQPESSKPEGPEEGRAYDLFLLQQANPDLVYDAGFAIPRLNDAPGHVTLFRDGERLLYRAGEIRLMSARPQDWVRHLCRVLAGRAFTPAEVRELPAGAEAEPCREV
ncbi:trypsin-like peptidase domain-containing protein [Nonomuraea pusilla]|uniref:nSTAND1 domain-containing NTPase n=1 Tax=Nonomuraea pusilla TaxID=46177 RepID=UPI0033228C4D